ncbi:unnamed protein product [Closterium sp. NIES-64]|nr:unnamed protein product [Closterium sp. NIES-65]CAI5979387.1 unnamed protein product [Closterium sp. NIES-64]
MPAAATSRPGEAWRRTGRAEELVAGLAAGDAKVRLRAVRDVKNAAIGSRTRKLAFIRLRAVPRCTTSLPHAPPSSCASLLLAQLFSAHPPPPRAAPPSFPRLLPGSLPSPKPRLRAARGPFSVPPPHPAPYFFCALLLPHLRSHSIRFCGGGSCKVTAFDLPVHSCAATWQHCCRRLAFPCPQPAAAPTRLPQRDSRRGGSVWGSECGSEWGSEFGSECGSEFGSTLWQPVCQHTVCTRHSCRQLAAAGGLLSLTRLLSSSPRCTDAALLALAAVVRGNRQQAAALVDMGGGAALAAVVSLTRHPSPATRLNACRCLLHVEAALWPHGGAITAVPRSFLQHPAPALAALPAPATTAVPPATTATAPVCAAGAPSPATAAAAAAARGRVERVARSSGSGSASIASDGNGRAGGRGGGVKRDAWGGLKAGGMTKGDRSTWLRQQGHEQAACGRESEEGRAQHVVCGALLSPRTGAHAPATAPTPATAASGEKLMRVGVGVGMGVGAGAAAAVDVNVAAVVLVALINLLPLPDQVSPSLLCTSALCSRRLRSLLLLHTVYTSFPLTRLHPPFLPFPWYAHHLECSPAVLHFCNLSFPSANPSQCPLQASPLLFPVFLPPPLSPPGGRAGAKATAAAAGRQGGRAVGGLQRPCGL